MCEHLQQSLGNHEVQAHPQVALGNVPIPFPLAAAAAAASALILKSYCWPGSKIPVFLFKQLS